MKTVIFTLLLQTFFIAVQGQNTIPSLDNQIKTALLAAPEAERAGAAVWGYNEEGELVELRKGSNNLVCLADNPQQDKFSAACYHRDLEPFMKRGRELKKEGKSFQEIFDQREEEVKAGKLSMPENPSTLFIFYAAQENYHPSKGEVEGGSFRYVVYIPYATAESTGLPLSPDVPGMPWIMFPDTHAAHIMITPPANE
jgi:hypothetical protein